jgi:hypothetical protein
MKILTLIQDFNLIVSFINSTNAFFQQDINTSLKEEEQTTAKISYNPKRQ